MQKPTENDQMFVVSSGVSHFIFIAFTQYVAPNGDPIKLALIHIVFETHLRVVSYMTTLKMLIFVHMF